MIHKRAISLMMVLGSLLSVTAFVAAEAVLAPAAHALLCPDPEEPCGGPGGGGGGGGGGSTTPATYRIVGSVTAIDAEPGRVRIRGWSRFERNSAKIDANTLFVRCIAGTGQVDEDFEEDAGFTDVEFWVGPVGPNGGLLDVVCGHRATYGGVTYTTTSAITVLVS